MNAPERQLEDELVSINGVPVTKIELKTLGINPRQVIVKSAKSYLLFAALRLFHGSKIVTAARRSNYA